MSFQVDNNKLRGYIGSLGHRVCTDKIRLIGIRGAVPFSKNEVSLRGNDLDAYNDSIGVWGVEFYLLPGTVEPGRFYTEHPDNPKGAAHLLSLEEGGRPWRFKWGLHHDSYECLVQAEAFTVRRDVNKDGKAEKDEPETTGDFGIHVHYGGPTASVGKWSAGCQVIQGGDNSGAPWRRLMATLKACGQQEFVYYLIDGPQLYAWLQKQAA